VQPAAEILDQCVLNCCPRPSAVAAHLRRVQICSPGDARAGREPFWKPRETISPQPVHAVIQKNLYAHFCQALELAQNRTARVLIVSQQNNRVVRIPNSTTVTHGNHGGMAIKGLYYPLKGEELRRIWRFVGPCKLGKCSAQAIIVYSEDAPHKFVIGDFDDLRNGLAKYTI